MKWEWINEAIANRRRLAKRLLCLAALSVLALSILAPATLAQSRGPSGEGGTYICADFDDQGQAQEAFGRALRGDPEFPLDPAVVDPDGDGIACEELPTATNPNTPPPGTGSGEEGEITCEDFEDQGQAQEALNRALRGDPAYDAEALDEDGDGIACEELPTATNPNTPAPGTGSGEDGTVTCEDFEDQGQAQQALGRGLRGDPEFPPGVLDEDGDGIACEELPAATSPNAPAPGTGSGEGGTVTCEDLVDQGQAQEILNRALRGDPAYDAEALDEDGDGIACEELPTATNPNRSTGGENTSGESTGGEGTGGGGAGSGGGSNGGGGDGSAGNSNSGASQGGVSGAVSDGFGSVLSGRLPDTGGGWAVLLLAGAVLIGGGTILIRRFSSSA